MPIEDTRGQDQYKTLAFILLFCSVVVLSGCTTIAPDRTAGPAPQPVEVFDHALFNGILTRFVDAAGQVDYTALKQEPEQLERYYAQVSTYSPDSHPHLFPGRDHQLAYWINAYNAAAIKTVLRYYPIGSVLDVKQPPLFFFLSDKSGFFFFQRLSFGGATTSLYYLENSVVRKRYRDPRIHFALNCASRGCPRLPREAFTGARLDQQLDRETRRFLSESRNFRVDHSRRSIYLSEIFKWYKKDFVQWYEKRNPDRKGDLLSYITHYLPADKAAELKQIREDYTIRFDAYDWMLNDQAEAPVER